MALPRHFASSIGRRCRAMHQVSCFPGTRRAGNNCPGTARNGSNALVSSSGSLLVTPRVVSRRSICASAMRRDKVNMTFVEDDGTVVKVEAEVGASLLEVAHDNDIELEGACGGDLACSTCHVILPKEYYDKLEAKEEEEDDMLDLAWGLTDTSRLGCQIKVTPELEGMLIKIPEDTIDMS